VRKNLSQPKNGRRSPPFKPFRTRKRTICGAVTTARALVAGMAGGATSAEALASMETTTAERNMATVVASSST
jgi:hypothetical protein